LSQAVYLELQTHREQASGTDGRDSPCNERHEAEIGDMQAELLALREQQRRARQPGPDVRVPDHQDASRDADTHI
ncbi:hypothetical protein Tco_1168160, partial [Tanacetum coccineum]